MQFAPIRRRSNSSHVAAAYMYKRRVLTLTLLRHPAPKEAYPILDKQRPDELL